MTDERQKYFEDFYRIWKIGPTAKERVDFWQNHFPLFKTAKIMSDQEILGGYEFLHLQYEGIIDGYGVQNSTEFSSPQKIFIEKFYWEHGVGEKSAARLRYFKSHYSDHFELNNTSGQSDEKILSDCELWYIISGHETEIDPSVQFC